MNTRSWSAPFPTIPWRRSSRLLDSAFMEIAEVLPWLAQRAETGRLRVRPIAFSELDEWRFDPPGAKLFHQSGRFFSVRGYRVEEDLDGFRQWDQPLVVQPEIGILGILARIVDGVVYLLLQAKMEPGNHNPVQLSPTVQATRSNYMRVHGGRLPKYLAYFIDPKRGRRIVDRLQTEQGRRFLTKRNRNMIVLVEDDVVAEPGFAWLTVGQVLRLLRTDDAVNMDTRSVLSCVPWASERREAHYSLEELLMWRARIRGDLVASVAEIPLHEMRGWELDDHRVSRPGGQPFSVMAVDVEAPGREVRRWRQPLLGHEGLGLIGLLVRTSEEGQHLLLRAEFAPGHGDQIQLGPTVYADPGEDITDDAQRNAGDGARHQHWFENPPADRVVFDAVQSEEGGRFYHYRNRYLIVEVPADTPWNAGPLHRWATRAQVQVLVSHEQCSVELRNLLVCLKEFDTDG